MILTSAKNYYLLIVHSSSKNIFNNCLNEFIRVLDPVELQVLWNQAIILLRVCGNNGTLHKFLSQQHSQSAHVAICIVFIKQLQKQSILAIWQPLLIKMTFCQFYLFFFCSKQLFIIYSLCKL